ncbi:hypothetical protein B0H14DRAFT_2651403 [Mycena olivaceomarginata]|nr:hypothetical protein B0H14DRAFT_2651403 [Mycena olivaceomarginata]
MLNDAKSSDVRPSGPVSSPTSVTKSSNFVNRRRKQTSLLRYGASAADRRGPKMVEPQRKAVSKPRNELSRADRNRIAAQNSRDPRKAQFSYLERRLSELEEENRRLLFAARSAPAQQDARKAAEQENEVLRERLKDLEGAMEGLGKGIHLRNFRPRPTFSSPPVPTSPHFLG